jgi:hypothetical protein
MVRSTVFFVAVALVLGFLVTRANAIAGETTSAGVCMKEGQKIVGERPIPIDRQTPMPRKVRHVATKYPDRPSDIVGSGGWSGELLLDKQGRVVHFPAFTQAIVDAVMQWRYEPLLAFENSQLPTPNFQPLPIPNSQRLATIFVGNWRLGVVGRW